MTFPSGVGILVTIAGRIVALAMALVQQLGEVVGEPARSLPVTTFRELKPAIGCARSPSVI